MGAIGLRDYMTEASNNTIAILRQWNGASQGKVPPIVEARTQQATDLESPYAKYTERLGAEFCYQCVAQ
jgi:hypothetical protein